MTTRRKPRHPATLAVATIVACGCAIAVTACGGSSGSGGSDSRASIHQSFLNFAKCMRANGVPNFPDPQPNGGGIEITPGDGITPGSPAMKAGQQKCSHLLPGGGPGGQKPSEKAKQQLLAIAKCMRAHGLQNFPDPTTSPPSQPGSGGGGPVLGMGGVFLNLGAAGLDPTSPAFQRAAVACHFPGAQRIASGGSAPATKGGG
jgi:hypothetical protein